MAPLLPTMPNSAQLQSRRRRRRLLAAAAAAIASACFLSPPSNTNVGANLQTTHFKRFLSTRNSAEPDAPSHREILEDGTLLVPVGDLKPNSRGIVARDGQNLSDKVPATRPKLCADLLGDQKHQQQVEGEGTTRRRYTRLHVEADLCGDHSVGDIIADYFRYNLLAHVAGLPFTFSCKESLPGIFDLLQNEELPNAGSSGSGVDPDYTLEDSCRSTSISKDLSHGIPLMAGNLHRIADLFDEGNTHTSSHQANDGTTNGADASSHKVEADDAVIHLRLNDILKASGKQDQPSLRGLFSHATYTRLLREAESEKGTLESISIVTQTNREDSVRRDDKPYVERSIRIASDLAQHLRVEFPSATVTVRNDWRTESTAKSYVRMLRAQKVLICGRSGFCLYPSLSLRDDALAYLFYRESIPTDKNHLILAAAEQLDNVHLWDAPLLGNNQIGVMPEEDIFDFLHNATAGTIDLKLS